MKIIKNASDREFLLAQREEGRRGTMAGVDRTTLTKERRRTERKKAAILRRLCSSRQCSHPTCQSLEMSISSPSTLSSEPESPDTRNAAESATCTGDVAVVLPTKPRQRGSVSLLTPQVTAALDRAHISDQKAAQLLAAIASTGQFHTGTEKLVFSRSAIRRARMANTEALANEAKDKFPHDVSLVLHWDGNILEDSTSVHRNNVDRVAILVSGNGIEKLLCIPKLHSGTALMTASAIVEAVDEWQIRDNIKGLCFDTTSTNTGVKRGICVLLEQEFGRKLLNLACRHHVAEIVLQKVFGLLEKSKSSELQLSSHLSSSARRRSNFH